MAERFKPYKLISCSLVRERVPEYFPAWPTRAWSSPEASGAWICQLLAGVDDGKEHFWVFGLDVRHRLTLAEELSVGCLTSSLVHPRELFRPLILASCAAVIVAHNHPSGDPEPSAEDLAVTRRIAAAGSLLGIELLDHLVVGNKGSLDTLTPDFVSLKQRGVV